MKFQKLTAFLAAGAMLLSLSACGNDSVSSDAAGSSAAAANEAAETGTAGAAAENDAAENEAAAENGTAETGTDEAAAENSAAENETAGSTEETETAEAAAVQNNFADLAETYLTYIGTNLKDRDCTSADSDHDAARDWIISELKNAGYTDSQITCEARVDEHGDTVQNIVLTVEGSDPSCQILVGAHYDGEGVGDNGSGMALLLSTAVGLQDQQPLHTVKYLFFDAEELDLCGSVLYGQSMTEEEIDATLYMVNIDSIAFGDYCNLYGGQQDSSGFVSMTWAYDLAVEKAEALGFQVKGTEDLDGYYAENGQGPEIEADTFYTNPWTQENPAPKNSDCFSPSTGDWSDHVQFKYLGIAYIYFEATNWYAAGDGGLDAYTGYFETAQSDLGDSGMFMGTDYDTLDYLNACFPGRALEHFNLYSPLLSSLVLNPDSAAPTAEEG